MTSVNMIFGMSHSIPWGLNDDQKYRYYQFSCRPLVKQLYQMPHILATLHYSGHLLEWIANHHPEFIDVLGEMVQRKQVELLCGGVYDPLFALVPRTDAANQIERNANIVRKLFGKRTHGIWLSQCWDTFFPAMLCSSGATYTFLDEQRFREVGCNGMELFQPAIAEHEGMAITVFPVSTITSSVWSQQGLRRLVRSVHAIANRGLEGAVLTRIHNGEFPLVMEHFQAFADMLHHRQDEVSTILPSTYLAQRRRYRRLYFFPSSVIDNQHVRVLLARYREASLLYATMCHSRMMIRAMRGDKADRQRAQEYIWRGQSQWVFRSEAPYGINDSRLRKMSYAMFIEAQRLARGQEKFVPSLIRYDFDMDGLDEYLYSGRYINSYVHVRGGVVFELDYLPSPWNWLDTMSLYPTMPRKWDGVRRLAAKLLPILAGPNGSASYPRHAFIDHLLPRKASFEQAKLGHYHDNLDLYSALYEVREYNRDKNRLHLRIHRQEQKRRGCDIVIDKRFKFTDSGLSVDYVITNLASQPLDCWFMPEINLSPAVDPEHDLEIAIELPSTASPISINVPTLRPSCHGAVDSIRFVATTRNSSAVITFDTPTDELWLLPLETKATALSANPATSAASESMPSAAMHNDYVHQGYCLLPRYQLVLQENEQRSLLIRVSVVRKKAAQ